MRLSLFSLALLSALTAAAFAQQPPTPAATQTSPQNTPPTNSGQPVANPNGTYTISTTSRLVVLDMVVTDAKGNVVTGLKREDFHVTESGEPQTILNFDPAGANPITPDLDIHSTTDLDALAPRTPVNILLLDEFNTRFEDMAFARYSLKKFLNKQPGNHLDTPTMLVAVNLQRFTVLHDYTQNKQEILSALDHHFVAYPWQVHQGAWVSERFATAFITLRRVAEATMGHTGHKNMIWIGRGFPSLNFANVSADAQNQVEDAVQECVNVLRDARVTLYTIDPAGVMTDPGKYGSDTTTDSDGNVIASADLDPFGGNYTFSTLAKATGGRTLYGRNDVDAEIGTAIRDGNSFYTLTYRPSNGSNNPQKFRKIRVTVDRPGLTVTTREGYYPQYKPWNVDPKSPARMLSVDLVSAETSTMVYDGVPVTVRRPPADPDTFIIHIDGQALVWSEANGTEPRRAEIILMSSIFDRKGNLLKRDPKIMRIPASGDVPPTGRLERDIDIKYKLVDRDPKATRLRFVVRVAATGHIGTADVDLTKAPPAVHPSAVAVQ